jgi:hypothetical protein
MTGPAGAPQVLHRPWRAGSEWLREGLRLFARRPAGLPVLTSCGPLALASVSLVPWVGDALALLLYPAISLGMFEAARALAQSDAPVGISVYLRPWQDRTQRLRLLALGAVHAVGIGIVGQVWSLGGDAMPSLAHPLLALAGLALWVPLQMALWFAPPLVAWYAMPAGKSLFFSFFACWRNQGAMAMCIAGQTGLALVAIAVLGLVVAGLQLAQGPALAVLAPVPLAALALGQACALAMARDVLDPPPMGAPN